MNMYLIFAFHLNSRAQIQDEKKLVEFERGVKEAEERRPAHQRKVDESEQNLAKATEDKKRLEATVGDISKKRDQFVSFSFSLFPFTAFSFRSISVFLFRLLSPSFLLCLLVLFSFFILFPFLRFSLPPFFFSFLFFLSFFFPSR